MQEDVSYCNRCLSLKVMILEGTNISYCGSCGSSDVKEISIEEWEKIYKKMYGESHLKRNI